MGVLSHIEPYPSQGKRKIAMIISTTTLIMAVLKMAHFHAWGCQTDMMSLWELPWWAAPFTGIPGDPLLSLQKGFFFPM
jgi:hypothetical protein